MRMLKSESTVFPQELEIEDKTVFVRSNVTVDERTNQGTTTSYFVYDERQYTKEEWANLQADKANADVTYVAMMTGVDL